MVVLAWDGEVGGAVTGYITHVLLWRRVHVRVALLLLGLAVRVVSIGLLHARLRVPECLCLCLYVHVSFRSQGITPIYQCY